MFVAGPNKHDILFDRSGAGKSNRQRHLNSWRPKYEALVAEMPNLRVIEVKRANEQQGNDNEPVERSEEDVDDTTR